MKIEADRDVCIGAGMCVMNAEEVFDQGDDGIVVVLSAEVPPGYAEAVARAVAQCPSGALRRIDP
jgi:ferredoxin